MMRSTVFINSSTFDLIHLPSVLIFVLQDKQGSYFFKPTLYLGFNCVGAYVYSLRLLKYKFYGRFLALNSAF